MVLRLAPVWFFVPRQQWAEMSVEQGPVDRTGKLMCAVLLLETFSGSILTRHKLSSLSSSICYFYLFITCIFPSGIVLIHVTHHYLF